MLQYILFSLEQGGCFLLLANIIFEVKGLG